LAHTLAFLVEKRNKVYPRTLDAYNVWSTTNY
ncbi:HD domain-containing protein, partial [Limosilactobacillus reuteri]